MDICIVSYRKYDEDVGRGGGLGKEKGGWLYIFFFLGGEGGDEIFCL